MATTDERLAGLEQQVSTVATKVDLMILEAQQQREDIRRLQDRQDAAQAKHDAEMHEMNQRFYEKLDENYKDLTKQMHNNFVQTMIGVGAMIIALGGVLIAVLK